MSPNKKVVLKPLTVPKGNYCWLWGDEPVICDYFDNEGGHPTCYQSFYPLLQGEKGILKPKECLELKEE